MSAIIAKSEESETPQNPTDPDAAAASDLDLEDGEIPDDDDVDDDDVEIVEEQQQLLSASAPQPKPDAVKASKELLKELQLIHENQSEKIFDISNKKDSKKIGSNNSKKLSSVESHNNCSGATTTNSNATTSDRKRKRPSVNSRRQSPGKNAQNSDDDDDDMICMRGASPTSRHMNYPIVLDYSDENDMSDTPSKKPRKMQKKKKKKGGKRRADNDLLSDDDDRRSDREMDAPNSPGKHRYKLCKFYLTDNCAKGNRCDYMHSDFPCKFYYLGLECEEEKANGSCMLNHGGALSRELCSALMFHIYHAPRSVLGDKFAEIKSKLTANETKSKLHRMQEKLGSKSKSRWDTDTVEIKPLMQNIITPDQLIDNPPNDENTDANLKDINNLGLFSDQQTSELKKLGIIYTRDIINLTIAQMGRIGITAAQIEAVQKDTQQSETVSAGGGSSMDMDMRVLLPAMQPVNQPPTVQPIIEKVNWLPPQIRLPQEIVSPDRHSGRGTPDSWHDDESQLVIDVPEDAVEETTPKVIEEIQEMRSPDKRSDDHLLDLQPLQLNSSWNDYVDQEEETDLHTFAFPNGDRDMRLPFKPVLTHFVPATEIDGSISSHAKIEYNLCEIEIPPNTFKSNAAIEKLLEMNSADPRLKKFQKPKEEKKPIGTISTPTETTTKDPRIKADSKPKTQTAQTSSNQISELYMHLHKSKWYQELSSNVKIEVNSVVSILNTALNQFDQSTTPGKTFNIVGLPSQEKIVEMLHHLNIYFDANGKICEDGMYRGGFMQNNPFGGPGPNHGPDAFQMGPQGNNNMNNAKPGLLGYAPGVEYIPQQGNNNYGMPNNDQQYQMPPNDQQMGNFCGNGPQNNRNNNRNQNQNQNWHRSDRGPKRFGNNNGGNNNTKFRNNRNDRRI